MNESIRETFEGLFKVAHRQGRRMEELEARVVELERRLQMQGRVDNRTPLCAVTAPDSPDEIDTMTTSDDAPVFELPLPAEYDEA